MKFVLSSIILCLVVQSAFVKSSALFKSSYKPLNPSDTYTHKEIIIEDSPDQYVLFWKIINNDEIQFEVHCNTTGWVNKKQLN